MTKDEFYQSRKPDEKAIYFDKMIKIFRLLAIDPDFSMAGEVLPQPLDVIEAAARSFGLPLAAAALHS